MELTSQGAGACVTHILISTPVAETHLTMTIIWSSLSVFLPFLQDHPSI